jgi:hypothetical protein
MVIILSVFFYSKKSKEKKPMSRKFQTPKNQRETYRYYDADGKKLLELVPGENGVTEAFISKLHNFDDDECGTFLKPDKILTVKVGNSTLTIKQKIIPDGTLSTKDICEYVKKGQKIKPQAKLSNGTGNAKRKYCSHECYIEARFGGADDE